ncbi:MAG TPA: hypothetical protein EYP40_04385 [Chromatiales bacterium]|nr:hypothetical protein [Chromatiales bacterium]
MFRLPLHNISIAILASLTVSCGGGSENIPANTTTIAIPGTVQFNSSAVFIDESAATALISVPRTYGKTGEISIDYEITGTTATQDADFSVAQMTGTLVFADGELEKTIPITIIDDQYVEGNESVSIKLSNPVGGVLLGKQDTLFITILDNDSPGILQFATPEYVVNENSGTVQVEITRYNGSAEGIRVEYFITQGSATFNEDYETTNNSGTLEFLEGELSKTIDIMVIDDSIPEQSETIFVSLRNPSGGATIDNPATTTITITDNDSPGSGNSSIFFTENSSGNDEYARQVDLPVNFGVGEFTIQFWIKPDDSYPIGPISADPYRNWSDSDIAPYSSSTWWFEGNFLLDGHNNNDFGSGTFSLQFYGGGRLRWLFGDGAALNSTGGTWAIQAYPAVNTSSLLDGNWHQVTLVRRWEGATDARLEMWIDGTLVAVETSNRRTNMRTYWDNWNNFPAGQDGWFWGAEKQSALGLIGHYEDYLQRIKLEPPA